MLEQLYNVGFALAQWHARRKKTHRAPCPVIAVGNLSVGGTGKSVVVRYLTQLLKDSCAILLRGYRGSNSHSTRSRLVSDGTQLYCTARVAGDEAVMFARQTNALIVVGRNRATSCALLEHKGRTPSVIILDDAYQHHTVHKDLEILLLDARWPLENGHCIPSGRLREKDLSRADIIILTHCELVSKAQREKAKELVRALQVQVPVLLGEHRAASLRTLKGELVESISGPVCALAGIGSFGQFAASVKKLGVSVVKTHDAGDHATYAEDFWDTFDAGDAQAIVTTAKDAVKLRVHPRIPVYVLETSFGFVHPEDEQLFKKMLHSLHALSTI